MEATVEDGGQGNSIQSSLCVQQDCGPTSGDLGQDTKKTPPLGSPRCLGLQAPQMPENQEIWTPRAPWTQGFFHPSKGWQASQGFSAISLPPPPTIPLPLPSKAVFLNLGKIWLPNSVFLSGSFKLYGCWLGNSENRSPPSLKLPRLRNSAQEKSGLNGCVCVCRAGQRSQGGSCTANTSPFLCVCNTG